MPSYVPAKKGAEFIFYVSLISQANGKIFQVNPTLAAGDATVSTDGGATANLATTPSVNPAGGTSVMVTVSAAEMAGDNIKVNLHDAAGAEWCDLTAGIQTSIRQIDDIPTANQNSDAWTARNIAGGSSAGRTNGQAQASLRNRQEIAGGILTVYDTDDVTPLWDATVTTAPGDPLTSIDPS